MSQGKLEDALQAAVRINSTLSRDTLYLGLITAHLQKHNISSMMQAIAIANKITLPSLQLSASEKIGSAVENIE